MRSALISFPMFGENFVLNPGYSITIGNFDIYYYGIIIAVGFLLAILYAGRNCKRFDIIMDDVYDYVIWGVIFGVICARLFYCVTFTDEQGVHTYLQDPASFLRIRDGGLAIYGGVIGAVAAVLIRSKMRHTSAWPIMDLMGLGFPIGQLVGRWGNFFNREAYGYETDVFCKMGLTINGSTIYVHPTFLYESLWNLIGFLLMHFHSKKHRKYQGQYFLAYLIWYGVGRTAIEGLRSDSLWLIPDVIRISQLIGVCTALLAIAAWICNNTRIKAGKAPLIGRALEGIENTEETTPASSPEPDSMLKQNPEGASAEPELDSLPESEIQEQE